MERHVTGDPDMTRHSDLKSNMVEQITQTVLVESWERTQQRLLRQTWTRWRSLCCCLCVSEILVR